MTAEKGITHIHFSDDDQDYAYHTSLLINDLIKEMANEVCDSLVIGDITVDYDTLKFVRNLLGNIDTYHIGTIK